MLETDTAWMKRALHDLCQPLTTLEGLLYLQTLTRGSDSMHVPPEMGLWQSLDEALRECNRIFSIVRAMQLRLADDDRNLPPSPLERPETRSAAMDLGRGGRTEGRL